MRRGTTLVELMIAVAIAGLIAAGIQSAIVVAMKSVPNSQGSAQTTIQGSRILDRLVTELEGAVFITEHTSTTLGFTVPDRNADGIPERLRYAWSGVAGDPLTLQYNGGTPVTIASSVKLFSLSLKSQSVAETYPAAGVEDSTESLLLDYYSTSNVLNQDVKTTEWYGQYFTVTLTGNAMAWRPTRVQVMARRNMVPSSTAVQMRPTTPGLTPTTTVLEEQSLSSNVLFASYAWKSISFSTVDPIASGSGIGLVMLPQSNSPSLTAASTSSFPGMLKTTNSGGAWTYDSGRSLMSQLYGKLIRSTGTQTVNSTYLLSTALSLQLASSAPVLQATATTLNHPELLSGLWELKFDRNPTTADVNGDGAADWSVVGGGTFDTGTVSGGQWTTSSTSLQTSPGNDFAKTTIVDLRMQNTSVGGDGATFSINALRSGSTCAPILVKLALQNDGTQTLTLMKKSTDAATQNLISVTSIPAQAVDVHLVIDPTTTSVYLNVNGVQRGTFAITRYSSSDSSRAAIIGAQGSSANFSYARVRVLE